MSKDKSPKKGSSPPLGSKEWVEEGIANLKKAGEGFKSVDEAFEAMSREEWPKPGELGRPLK